ncbi:hypothetical protein HID58_038282 [Brassica napus]|uniref:Ubiquitin-like protease family profile domain-containing protein n=1 Tax=Brassica napus TaxID=3708 RepID=A0ABQ8BNS0_BRANA|nr:hypothetical protein HID58_038282 [Brassica napus]
MEDAVLQVEVNPSLRVTPLIPVVRGPQPGWGLWQNEKTDDKVTYMEQLIANNHCFSKAMWPGGDCSEPVFTFTPIPEKPVHKKHTVPRKRKESTLRPHTAGKDTSVPTEQRRSTRLQACSTTTPAPSNELLEARISTLEANATAMVDIITGLETTVAKLGASNERLKQKLHWQLKRSRATSLLPQFVVTHHHRSAPQRPLSNDLPGDDHHDSPNAKRRKTNQVSDGILGSRSPILSQYRAQHCASRRIDFNNPILNDHLSADHPYADHNSSPHRSPAPHSPLIHAANQRSTQLPPTDHSSSDHQSPIHQPHNHQSLTHGSDNHNSPNHKSPTCTPIVAAQQSPNHQTHNHPSSTHPTDTHKSPSHEEHSCTPLVVSPLDHEQPNHIPPVTPTIDPPSSPHNSPLPAISLAQHSPTIKTYTELSPLFTTVNSQKYPLPPAPALSPQASLTQKYAPIRTLPQFDATPLNKPSSQSSPSQCLTLPEPYTAPPIYDSSALPYSPIPLFNPTPAATTPPTISPNPLFTPPPAFTTTPTSSPNKPAGFSTHYSTPNAFAATATFKASNSRLLYQDPKNDHGEGEASDSSPDKTVRRVVDELNVLSLILDLLPLQFDVPILILDPLILQAQTPVPEVCDLSDSSPTRKTKEHQPSEAEKVLAQTFFNRPDFPHYLLVTPPPEDLWDIFAKTMAANKKVFHVTPSKLDFSNQFLLQLATPSQWTDSLHMAVLMHMLDMHHKDVLQMENATFMPPTLTSLMQSKDRQFQAALKKDKIRWDQRISKLILLPGKTWMKEVVKVYTPMIWADRHWVGLAIDLRAGHVDVLDSLPSLYDEERVQRFLRPILQMLPYLIRYVAKNNSRDLSPFTCQWRTGTYENSRSGDCGPVCAKFMELHLYGDPYPHMSGLTDGMVDKFRQQYAMEAYKTILTTSLLSLTIFLRINKTLFHVFLLKCLPSYRSTCVFCIVVIPARNYFVTFCQQTKLAGSFRSFGNLSTSSHVVLYSTGFTILGLHCSLSPMYTFVTTSPCPQYKHAQQT